MVSPCAGSCRRCPCVNRPELAAATNGCLRKSGMTDEAQMSPKTREEDRPTEDDLSRRELGPRGIPGQPDTAAMTPQREKKTPQTGEFDGHTA
jgi:hypothetical protein